MIDDRIKFRHLQCFLAVAQHGSLQKAADVLSISQPAVTKTLKELEALLDVRLFDRGRRGAVATREGEAFLRHAGASVSALREAVASVAKTSQRGAMLTLGVLPTVAPWLMPQLLRRLDASGVQDSLRIHTGSNPPLLAQLRQRELDLVIGRFAEPAQMPGLTFEHLYIDPLVIAVRPGHPLTLAAPTAILEKISAFTVILPTEGTAIRHSADSFFMTRGLAPPARTVETLAVSVARGYAQGSDALWLTPRGAAEPDLLSGQLVTLAVSMSGTEELVGLTLRADMAPTPAQQRVMQVIRDIAAERRVNATS
ncbi:MAG: pca operon transcription factor PcaQ [Comamonadaceae bacterium]|nr:MAG: pca operon transcription factor PcaQ [Comamonadaceae bacterium]